jgi:hypothetical protein
MEKTKQVKTGNTNTVMQEGSKEKCRKQWKERERTVEGKEGKKREII